MVITNNEKINILVMGNSGRCWCSSNPDFRCNYSGTDPDRND